jgi:hypothetical protein
VKAIYARGGIVSFYSMLDSPFCYFPHDAVIPGALGGKFDMTRANPAIPRRLEALVDGLNRRVDEKELRTIFGAALKTEVREQPSSPPEVAAWLAGHVR